MHFYLQEAVIATSINKATLVGRLGNDPELRQTTQGHPVCNLSIATSKRYTDKAGVRQERTTWHHVTVWGQVAEICARGLQKGQLVYVDGEIMNDSYQGLDGVKRERSVIKADQIVGMGSPANKTEGQKNTPQQVVSRDPGFGDEDMPF